VGDGWIRDGHRRRRSGRAGVAGGGGRGGDGSGGVFAANQRREDTAVQPDLLWQTQAVLGDVRRSRSRRRQPGIAPGCGGEVYERGSTRSETATVTRQIENVPVPPPLELDPLMLPEPLPDEEDPDIEPEVENEDDPLDLLPDDDPLLDEPLLDPDMDPDPEPEPDPLPEPDPDPDDALPEPEL